MKKLLLIGIVIIVSFCAGFFVKTILVEKSDSPLIKTNDKSSDKKKVIGIGGIFFKSKDPGKMNEWYKKHLGLPIDQYGARFEWQEGPDPKIRGSLQWSVFSEKTKYFEPSPKEFMINYRVENLKSLVDQLKKEGVTFIDTIEVYDYGKFVHIMDIEGNKIELYEPNYDFETPGK